MFQNPVLRELEYLHQQASNPEHGLSGDLTSGPWGDRFRAVTRLGLGINSEKKAVEANRLILFALHFPDFPDGAIAALEQPFEPPDFSLTTPTQKIGIELRDVYVELNDRRPKKSQEDQDQIVKLAHKIYMDAVNPPVCACFQFNDSTSYRKKDIPEVATQLAKCVPFALARGGEWIEQDTRNIPTGWPHGLPSCCVRAPHDYEPKDGRWEASHGGSVYPSENFIQAAIDKKEQKIAQYRQKGFDELWLLLVVNGFAASSFLREPNPNWRFASSFDRVFAFWVSQGRAVELSLTRTSP